MLRAGACHQASSGRRQPFPLWEPATVAVTPVAVVPCPRRSVTAFVAAVGKVHNVRLRLQLARATRPGGAGASAGRGTACAWWTSHRVFARVRQVTKRLQIEVHAPPLLLFTLGPCHCQCPRASLRPRGLRRQYGRPNAPATQAQSSSATCTRRGCSTGLASVSRVVESGVRCGRRCGGGSSGCKQARHGRLRRLLCKLA